MSAARRRQGGDPASAPAKWPIHIVADVTPEAILHFARRNLLIVAIE